MVSFYGHFSVSSLRKCPQAPLSETADIRHEQSVEPKCHWARDSVQLPVITQVLGRSLFPLLSQPLIVTLTHLALCLGGYINHPFSIPHRSCGAGAYPEWVARKNPPDHGEHMQKAPGRPGEWNPGPSSCEATVMTTSLNTLDTLLQLSILLNLCVLLSPARRIHSIKADSGVCFVFGVCSTTRSWTASVICCLTNWCLSAPKMNRLWTHVISNRTYST